MFRVWGRISGGLNCVLFKREIDADRILVYAINRPELYQFINVGRQYHPVAPSCLY